MGRGIVALQDIEEDEVLFQIPRRVLLNIGNSRLGRLCMKWDEARDGNDRDRDTDRDTDTDTDGDEDGDQDTIMLIHHENENGNQSENHKQEEKEKEMENDFITWNFIRKKGGWAALIMTCMWENWISNRNHNGNYNRNYNHNHDHNNNHSHTNSNSDQQQWGPYLNILPKEYHTPIFWNKAELQDLQGTNVLGEYNRI